MTKYKIDPAQPLGTMHNPINIRENILALSNEEISKMFSWKDFQKKVDQKLLPASQLLPFYPSIHHDEDACYIWTSKNKAAFLVFHADLQADRGRFRIVAACGNPPGFSYMALRRRKHIYESYVNSAIGKFFNQTRRDAMEKAGVLDERAKKLYERRKKELVKAEVELINCRMKLVQSLMSEKQQIEDMIQSLGKELPTENYLQKMIDNQYDDGFYEELHDAYNAAYEFERLTKLVRGKAKKYDEAA